jgi:hypothetical protein
VNEVSFIIIITDTFKKMVAYYKKNDDIHDWKRNNSICGISGVANLIANNIEFDK